ncbi:MAG: isoleucine--tRNA ligase [Candidatus Goldbacteria bacterium]|nr:isoleucine--tRNA ligase [Candidatus Goldiibacteriota bacterium]
MPDNKDKKEYKIHLPQTDFPMKGDLAKREPDIIKKWEEDNLYGTLLKKRQGNPVYILHDGPPYANGNIHMGHVLNKVLKDIIVRFKSFEGYQTPYIPGWDCHGMPIEHKVIEELGSKSKSMSKLEIRKHCHDYAMKYVDLQRNQFKRLGIIGDWNNPYLTLDPEYEVKMVEIFWEMFKRGMIYKGLRPVYWCFKCETALAEAEVEYKDHETPSIYVSFKIKDSSKSKVKLPSDTNMVIWTTTPWTLPANVAIALHPDFDYVLIETEKGKFIIVESLLEEFSKKTKIVSYNIKEKYKGKDLEGVICSHPFIDRDSVVILADYVTIDTGTGAVHIAPGHGHEDYLSGIKYNLPILTPVDSKGRFTEEFSLFKGEHVFDANEKIIKLLNEKGNLLGKEKATHSYPHCWRCKNPIIFRATDQWFISMEKNNFRNKVIEEIKKVKWWNEWGQDRITKMIEVRPDWCISRQRSWGVPIFVFECERCGKAIVNEETINKVKIIIKKEGSDAWFKYKTEEILGSDFKCPFCSSNSIKKVEDIFDVWFDSGSSSIAVCEGKWKLNWPVDLYIEGSDQYRGWFQTSLLVAVGSRDKSPYKEVISHGWVVDGQGRAMHKSLGNVVDPLKLIEKSGGDLLRLWVASEDFKADQAVSDEIMERITDSYRRIRNTFRFMLGNLFDFKKEEMVPYEKLSKLDKYILHKTQELINNLKKYYNNFEFYKVYKDFTQFCSKDLSSFYFDVLKDRLYTFRKDSLERKSAQTVIYKILIKLVKIIAPILCFTTDEVWQFIPEHLKNEKHIQLCLWDDPEEKMLDASVLSDWEILLQLREIVFKKIEEQRDKKIIKHPYEAWVTIKYKSKKLDEILQRFKDEMEQIFIVSKINYIKEQMTDEPWDKNIEVTVIKAQSEKCARCWRYIETVGKNTNHPDICDRCLNNLE